MATEIPVVFAAHQSSLVGVIHVPELAAHRGLLIIVAGGPQYRAGCCRQLVYLARRLCAAGIPVMRFDYRGMGDSDGDFLGFTQIEDELRAALGIFRTHVPSMREVVLWGGCDAASASMIHGWRLPEITGLILGNPYVHSEDTADKVTLKYYYWQRLRERAFWTKVLRFQFNPLPALRVIRRVLLPNRTPSQPAEGVLGVAPLKTRPYQDLMREGIEHFQGRVLLLMSGRSLVSKEFDELCASDEQWRAAMQGLASLDRHDFADADQAFSTIDARNQMIGVAERWLTLSEG
jgi:uncharacterized protein